MRLWELSIKPVHNPHPQYTLTLSVRCSYVTWGSACCLSLSLSCRHWVEQLLNFIEPILCVLGPAWLIRKRLNLKLLLAMLLNRIPGSRNGEFSVIFVMFTVLTPKKVPQKFIKFSTERNRAELPKTAEPRTQNWSSSSFRFQGQFLRC